MVVHLDRHVRRGAAVAAFAILGACTSAFASEEESRPALICSGAEPFWTLSIDATDARFITPEVEETTLTIADERPAQGRFWPRALTLSAPTGIGSGIALIRPAQCTDTMSDTRFDWTIDLLARSSPTPVILTGCCRVALTE